MCVVGSDVALPFIEKATVGTIASILNWGLMDKPAISQKVQDCELYQWLTIKLSLINAEGSKVLNMSKYK